MLSSFLTYIFDGPEEVEANIYLGKREDELMTKYKQVYEGQPDCFKKTYVRATYEAKTETIEKFPDTPTARLCEQFLKNDELRWDDVYEAMKEDK